MTPKALCCHVMQPPSVLALTGPDNLFFYAAEFIPVTHLWNADALFV